MEGQQGGDAFGDLGTARYRPTSIGDASTVSEAASKKKDDREEARCPLRRDEASPRGISARRRYVLPYPPDGGHAMRERAGGR